MDMTGFRISFGVTQAAGFARGLGSTPPGLALLADPDGAILTDADGTMLAEAA